ncbi:MAG: pseudouridine synthase [Hyphomonadaceae bacterium]|nr:pseudouridine synthase [Hyphomonadaceae bacterium]
MARKHENTSSETTTPGERIAKVMARAGLCSRREAESWITAGRVAVNGEVIASPARNVMPSDRIAVDGAPLPQRERTRLFLYHKPRGLVTTHSDPQGRPTIFGALPKALPRLISVGRLDINTEGLLLLTNDGALARILELPQTGWLRRYRVRAMGEVTQADLDPLAQGITIDGVRYGAITATLDRAQGSNVWLTFAIREGKNREVKNVLGHLGLKVNRLIRTSFGPFQLGELEQGAIEEVKTRVLREQLGDKLSAAAGTDFASPLVHREETASLPRPQKFHAAAPPAKRPPEDEAPRKRGFSRSRGADVKKASPPASHRDKAEAPRRGRARPTRHDRSGGPRPSRPRSQ